MPKILAFSGSSREGSYNQKVVAIAAQGAKDAGAEVTLISLADYPMPLYAQDLEAREGIPKNAQRFKDLLLSHDGLLIASPEYNSAFSPLLKNALDWASRASNADEPPLYAYQSKIVGIMSASPGALGGMRSLVFLRMLLENMGMMVLPSQKSISKAHEAFDDKDELIKERDAKSIKSIGSELAKMLQRSD